MITIEQFKDLGFNTWTGAGDPKRSYPYIWLSKRTGKVGFNMIHIHYHLETGDIEITESVSGQPLKKLYEGNITDIAKLKKQLKLYYSE